MRKNLRTAAVVATASGLVLIPAGFAYASGFGDGPHGTPDRVATCTTDQQHDRLQLRDGTGTRHDGVPAAGYGHRSGPADGSGPQADRQLDGLGNQWGRDG